MLFIVRTRGTLVAAGEADIAQTLAGETDAVSLCLCDPESYYFLAALDVRLLKYNGDLTAFVAPECLVAQFFRRYPYVDPVKLDDLIREGGVTFVLEKQRARDRFIELAGHDYDLTRLSEVHGNNSYAFYSVSSAA